MKSVIFTTALFSILTTSAFAQVQFSGFDEAKIDTSITITRSQYGELIVPLNQENCGDFKITQSKIEDFKLSRGGAAATDEKRILLVAECSPEINEIYEQYDYNKNGVRMFTSFISGTSGDDQPSELLQYWDLERHRRTVSIKTIIYVKKDSAETIEAQQATAETHVRDLHKSGYFKLLFSVKKEESQFGYGFSYDAGAEFIRSVKNKK